MIIWFYIFLEVFSGITFLRFYRFNSISANNDPQLNHYSTVLETAVKAGVNQTKEAVESKKVKKTPYEKSFVFNGFKAFIIISFSLSFFSIIYMFSLMRKENKDVSSFLANLKSYISLDKIRFALAPIIMVIGFNFIIKKVIHYMINVNMFSTDLIFVKNSLLITLSISLLVSVMFFFVFYWIFVSKYVQGYIQAIATPAEIARQFYVKLFANNIVFNRHISGDFHSEKPPEPKKDESDYSHLTD